MGSSNMKTNSGMGVGQKIDLALAGIFIALLIASTSYQFSNQRQIVEAMVLEQARTLSSSFFDNVNTLMLTGQMRQQQIARTKVTSHTGVLDARIIRSDGVKKMYGTGLDSAQVVDDLDQQALTGQPQQVINTGPQGRILTLVTPLLASEDYHGTNCLTCHPVEKGTVLGAVRIDYSLQHFDQQVMQQLWRSIALNALLLLIGWIIIRIILKRLVTLPLRQISATIHRIEQNADLDLCIDLQRNDELGTVATSFNSMIERFRTIIIHLHQLTDQLGQQVQNLNNTAQQSLNASQRLNSETDQVATAMTEMDQTSLTVAENATQAAEATQQVEQQVQQGQQTVATAIDSIDALAGELQKADQATTQLQTRSDEIASVVNVISAIADQTNLLALNAAIEAARAGEQGRGFAVVADEVRALAIRTGESTVEIKTMISNLQQQSRDTQEIVSHSSVEARNSVDHSNETGRVLTGVNQAIGQVVLFNTQNAAAAEQQHQVAGEINRNIDVINAIASETEQSTHQTTDACSQINQLTQQLDQIIDQFKIKL